MTQPQFIMLTGGRARWISISEIRAAIVEDHTITLDLNNGEEIALENKQDVQYVQAMLNSLSELPKVDRG